MRTFRSRFGSGVTASGSSTSLSITTDNQSRSSHSQTAVGLTSTPKIERVRTSRRIVLRSRPSPSVARSDATRSSACTRKAPDPHAGSSTVSRSTASRSVRARAAGSGSPASARAPSSCNAAASADVETRSTSEKGVKNAPVRRRSAGPMSDSNARPSISGSTAASVHVVVSSRAVKRYWPKTSKSRAPYASSEKERPRSARSTEVLAKRPPFRNGTRPNARAILARRVNGVLSVPKKSGRSTRSRKRPPFATHRSKWRTRKPRSPSSQPFASRNARKTSRDASSSAASCRCDCVPTPDELASADTARSSAR